jgi:subtilisin family serine protease
MDVIRYTAILVSGFTLMACANRRTSSSIVPHGSTACQSSALQGRYIVEWQDGHHSLERAKSREEFIEKFVEPRLNEIRFAELDQPVKINSDTISSYDTIPENWGQDVAQAQTAWSRGVKGKNIIVAVIDSGVDATHPQLKNQIAVNTRETVNGIDDDQNGFVDDVIGWNFAVSEGMGHPNTKDTNGHGTHLAGIIAAEHSTGPVLGVAPEAKILPIQFMDDSGAGSIGRAIMAINYAVKMGAKVINASWGTAGCNKTLENTVAQLADQGVLFVTAAGNESTDLSYSPSYPAAYSFPSQITVGALTYSGYRAEFSNYGSLVHMVAPGSPIYSTLPTSRQPSGYGYMSGTSMAAPFVSATAALLWSYQPAASLSQIRDAILNSVYVKDHLNVSTHGQLDIGAALAELE